MTHDRPFADPTESVRRAEVVGDGLIAVAEWERANGYFSVDEMVRARKRVADETSTV